jgi:hypothetical protein
MPDRPDCIVSEVLRVRVCIGIRTMFATGPKIGPREKGAFTIPGGCNTLLPLTRTNKTTSSHQRRKLDR